MKARIQNTLGSPFAILKSYAYGRQEDVVYVRARPSAWTPLDLCHITDVALQHCTAKQKTSSDGPFLT